MKRIALTAVFVLVASVYAFAGCVPGVRAPTGGSASKTTWVVIEVTGYDVSPQMCESPEKAKEAIDTVSKANADTTKANKAVDADVSKLKGKLSAASAKLAAAKDATEKGDLQKEVDDLKGEIANKQAEKKPLTTIMGPKRFASDTEANKWVDQVMKDAEAAKEKAEKKEIESKTK